MNTPAHPTATYSVAVPGPELGRILKRLRQRSGYTSVEQVTEGIRVSPTYLRYIEQGKKIPRHEILGQLLARYGYRATLVISPAVEGGPPLVLSPRMRARMLEAINHQDEGQSADDLAQMLVSWLRYWRDEALREPVR